MPSDSHEFFCSAVTSRTFSAPGSREVAQPDASAAAMMEMVVILFMRAIPLVDMN
jgi:hypothetical protein